MKEMRIEWCRWHMEMIEGKENQGAPFAPPSQHRPTYLNGSACNETKQLETCRYRKHRHNVTCFLRQLNSTCCSLNFCSVVSQAASHSFRIIPKKRNKSLAHKSRSLQMENINVWCSVRIYTQNILCVLQSSKSAPYFFASLYVHWNHNSLRKWTFLNSQCKCKLSICSLTYYDSYMLWAK
jgi:hypothetical protein